MKKEEACFFRNSRQQNQQDTLWSPQRPAVPLSCWIYSPNKVYILFVATV